MKLHFSLTFLAAVILAACSTLTPTAFPSLTPTASPLIISFVSTSYTVNPDESFTLTWETRDAEQVKLCNSTNWAMDCSQVPGNGSQTLTWEIGGRTPFFSLEAWSGGRKVSNKIINIAVACQYTWDAAWEAAKPTDCPYTSYVTSPGAIQQFKHGVMLWIDNGGQIDPQDKARKLFIFFDDKAQPDGERMISQLEEEGRPRPEDGDLLERLGSQLGPSIEFQAAYQCFLSPDKWGEFMNCYLLAPDKIYVTGSPYGDWMAWSR